MALDPSIYQNIQAPQPIQMPNPMEAYKNAASLSQLAMQSQQAQYNMAQTQAIRRAIQANTDASGNVDKQGTLSQLGKMGLGQAAMGLGQEFSAQDKAQAEAQSAKMNALHQQATIAVPHYGYLLSLPDDKAAEAWPGMKQQLQAQGVDTTNLPDQWNRNLITRGYQVASHYKEALDNQHTMAETDKAQADAAKTRSETYAKDPSVLGKTDDPAKLVPNLVPKEHQAKAFAEIDAAENTRKMAKSIMSSFDDAVSDTQGTGRVTSLIKTPRSAQALHQAMQPTFKDLEGTVRQAAMDNTFKNITPNASDTDADIATKRQALQDYLQSKLSAPTARAYGIDLNKYQRTASYEAPQKKQDGGVFSSAYADAPPTSGKGQPKPDAKPAQPQYREQGAKVSDNEISQYAVRHKMNASAAKAFLKGQGYAVD